MSQNALCAVVRVDEVGRLMQHVLLHGMPHCGLAMENYATAYISICLEARRGRAGGDWTRGEMSDRCASARTSVPKSLYPMRMSRDVSGKLSPTVQPSGTEFLNRLQPCKFLRI